MEWYYTKDQKQNGPVSQDALLRMISVGEVSNNDFAWRDGMADWKPISSYPELQIVAKSATPSPPPVPESSPLPAPSQVAPSSPNPATMPQGAPQAAPDVPQVRPATDNKTSGLAIASLCLGIGSLVLCGLLAIPAVICGHMALGEIKRSQQHIEGKVMAIIGLVVGYLMILIVTAIILVFSFAVAAGVREASQQDPIRNDMWDVPDQLIEEYQDGTVNEPSTEAEGSAPESNP